MTFVEKLFAHFGYVKSSVEPSDYPSSIPSAPNNEDENSQKANEGTHEMGDISAPIGHAENMSNHSNALPEVHLSHDMDDKAPMASPDNSMAMPSPQNTGAPASTGLGHTDVNETHINPAPGMGIEEINGLNPAIAQKMVKVGVVWVDRKIFMEYYENIFTPKYNDLCRKAALAKKPVSDFIHEIL